MTGAGSRVLWRRENRLPAVWHSCRHSNILVGTGRLNSPDESLRNFFFFLSELFYFTAIEDQKRALVHPEALPVGFVTLAGPDHRLTTRQS